MRFTVTSRKKRSTAKVDFTATPHFVCDTPYWCDSHSSEAARNASSKPRVFLQSSSHGNNWNAHRDQSMEMSKDFESHNTPHAPLAVPIHDAPPNTPPPDAAHREGGGVRMGMRAAEGGRIEGFRGAGWRVAHPNFRAGVIQQQRRAATPKTSLLMTEDRKRTRL